MNDAEVREHVLDEAKKCVLRDRNATHGRPENNFKDIARRWTAHLQNIRLIPEGVQLTPDDVGIMMVDMKLARIEYNPGHKDSYIDGIGYIACAAGIALADPVQLTGKGVVTEYFSGIGNCVVTDEASRADFQGLSDAVLERQEKAAFDISNHNTELIRRAYAKRPYPGCTCVAEAVANKQNAVKFGSCKVCQTHSTSSGSQS